LQKEENQKDIISESKRGRKHLPLEKIHGKVPKELKELYTQLGCSQLALSKHLGINLYYVNRLIKYGALPSKKTVKGKLAREKLFIPSQKRVEIPEYIKQWNKLPKEERHKVIQQYLNWRKSHTQKE
jgi:hypothetical protein